MTYTTDDLEAYWAGLKVRNLLVLSVPCDVVISDLELEDGA